MKDILREQFDKILVSTLFLICMAAALYIHTKPGMDEGTLDWLRELTGDLFSLLAGLVGGIAIGVAKQMAKNGTTTTIPITPTTVLPTPTTSTPSRTEQSERT